MKRFLQLICLLLVSTVCFSQAYLKPNNYYGSQFDRAWFPQALHIPIGDTILNTTKLTAGALLFRTTGGDSTLYAWNGIKWLAVGGAGVTYAAGNGISVDSLALGSIVWADTLYRSTFVNLYPMTTYGLQYVSPYGDSSAGFYVGVAEGPQYQTYSAVQNDTVMSISYAGSLGTFIRSYGNLPYNEHGVDVRSLYDSSTNTYTGTYIHSTDSIYINKRIPQPPSSNNAYTPSTGTTTGYKAVMMDETTGALVTANPGIIGGSSLFPLTGTGTATGNSTGDLDGNELRFANAPSVGVYDDDLGDYVHQFTYNGSTLGYSGICKPSGNEPWRFAADTGDNNVDFTFSTPNDGVPVIRQLSNRSQGTLIEWNDNDGTPDFIWTNGTGQLNPNISFTSAGAMGIGTLTPTAKLHVDGNALISTITNGAGGTDSILVESGGIIKKISPTYYSDSATSVPFFFTSLANNDFLKYDLANTRWVNFSPTYTGTAGSAFVLQTSPTINTATLTYPTADSIQVTNRIRIGAAGGLAKINLAGTTNVDGIAFGAGALSSQTFIYNEGTVGTLKVQSGANSGAFTQFNASSTGSTIIGKGNTSDGLTLISGTASANPKIVIGPNGNVVASHNGSNSATVFIIQQLNAAATGKLLSAENSGGEVFQITRAGKVGVNIAPTALIHTAAGTATANTAPLKLTTGTSLTAAEAGAMEYTTPQLFFTNGGAIRQELFQGQQSRVSTQYDNTTTTLGNVTGLTADVAAGKKYRFEAILYTTSDIAGGVKVAIGGTATATAIIYEGLTTNAGLITQGRATALATAVGGVTAVTTAYVRVTGTITVNAAGTLVPQLAQNANTGTTSALVGSTWEVIEIN